VVLSAMLVLCGPFGQCAHAQSTEVRTVTLRVAADESYRAGAEWEADLRRTVQIVSDIYEKQFQIRFVILDVVPFTLPSQASLHRYAPLNRLQSMATAVPIGEAELLIGFSGGMCESRAAYGAAYPFGRFAVIMARCEKPGNKMGPESVLSHEIAHLFGAFHPPVTVPSVMRIGGGPADLFDSQNARVIRMMRDHDFRRGILSVDEPTRRAWKAIYAEGSQRTNESNGLITALEAAGLDLARSGKLPEGEALIREAIRIDQYIASPHASLGSVLAQRGQLQEAVREFQLAKGLDFNDVRSRTELGLLLFRLGRDDEALAELKIALAIYPDTPRARAGRCGLLARRRSVDEGLAECTEAIRLAPDQARLFIIRGDLYRQKGEPDRAIEDYDAALRADPNNAYALYGRAEAKQMKGDHAGAEADQSAARAKSARDVY
jgi:tetratricopeptide (TPR) repeat protein